MKLILGDCLEKLKQLPDNSVDAIVTDPPYGLSFMGKKWDYDVPSVEIFKECLRVLKHGGHALIACGTRTQHRMAVNIEDAGFEVRDVITWLYGSGFPKSLDVSKAIDKANGDERPEHGEVMRSDKRGGNFHGASESRPQIAHKLTSAASAASAAWQGWGTALKPACEFWTLARKPLSEKTVAKNVLKWGTGGINIDGCRVETNDNLNGGAYSKGEVTGLYDLGLKRLPDEFKQPIGRFPANLILDEEAGALLGEPSRFFYCAKASKSERNEGCEGLPKKRIEGQPSFLDEGGYANATGKPNKPIENQNFHPTVKPIKLMRYLCRLITPTNGIVLDPFMGSGSTGVAAKQESFDFIGIERDAEYFKICEKRIK